MEDFRFYRWLDASLQPASIIAVVLLPLVWAAVFYEISQEHHRADIEGVQTTTSMARLLENHVYRTLKRIDDALLEFQNTFPPDGQEASVVAWLGSSSASSDLQMAFLDAQGTLRATNRGPVPPADLSDRDHFRHFAQTTHNDLYVSRPHEARAFGRTAIRLARRLARPDGGFAGLIVASLEPEFLDGFYRTLETEGTYTIALLGLDGTMRAGSGPGVASEGPTLRWQDAQGVLDAARSASSGFYWAEPQSEQANDGRLIAFRAVEGYPFLVGASLPHQEIFANQKHSEIIYNVTGWAITLVLIGATFLATSRELRLKSAAKSLANTNDRFKASLANMPLGLCMFDAGHKLVICNERYAEMYRLPEEATLPGTPLRSILESMTRVGSCPSESDEFITSHLVDADRGDALHRVFELRDGRTIAIDYQPMADGGFVAVHQDITLQKASDAKIAFLAHHDPLTGLLNRASLLEKLDEYRVRSQRNGDHFALLLLDLDRFKQVNDSLGHPAGDALLLQVAERLKSELRETDVLARLGGDEFAVLQTERTDPKIAANGLASRLIEAISRPFAVDRNEVLIGTSIGIVIGSEHTTTPSRLMKLADLALYDAKAQGRNRSSLFDPRLEEAATVRNAMESDLRRATLRRDFVLHYQPIVDSRTGLLVGAEALIRWHHETMGWVGPDRFIPLAEECGLINEIGLWVLNDACREAARWPTHTKVAVNISAVQLRDPMIVEQVREALNHSGLLPKRLELEITETALIDHGAQSHNILRELKTLGLTIALDDFGTGYSSLSQLTMFPFDKIKIDKSFTLRMTSRADCAAVIAGVLALAKSLSIETTAEGVETSQQYELLKHAGVSSMQGYFIKRPGPVGELDFSINFAPAKSARAA